MFYTSWSPDLHLPLVPLEEAERADLDRAIETFGLSGMRDTLHRVAERCCTLQTAPIGAGRGSRGLSRFGGLPDLPRETTWPAGMRFMLQVAMADVADHLGGALPREGLLSLFVGDDDDSSAVVHRVIHSAPGSELARREVPANLVSRHGDGWADVVLPELSLVVTARASLPAPETRQGAWLRHVDERYNELQSAMSPRIRRAGSSTLLGHPLECETDPCVAACFVEASVDPDLYTFDETMLERLIADKEATRDGKPRFPLDRWDHHAKHLLEFRRKQLAATRALGPRRAELVREVEQWVLLFELDSHPEADLCFWDAWHVQVTIRRDDLARGRFDRTRAKLSRA